MLLLIPLLYIATFCVQHCTSVIICPYHIGRIHIRVTDKNTVGLKCQNMVDIGTRQ